MRLVRLSDPPPDIIEAILDGRQLRDLAATPDQQRAVLGFA